MSSEDTPYKKITVREPRIVISKCAVQNKQMMQPKAEISKIRRNITVEQKKERKIRTIIYKDLVKEEGKKK